MRGERVSTGALTLLSETATLPIPIGRTNWLGKLATAVYIFFFLFNAGITAKHKLRALFFFLPLSQNRSC